MHGISVKMAATNQSQRFTMCKTCEGPVEFICAPCDIKLCGECSLKHMRRKSKQGHQLREYSRSLTQQCDLHPSVVSEFYCKSCFVPLCTECIITNDHKLHDLSSMSSITALFETLIEEESTELRTKVKVNFEKRIEDLKHCQTVVAKHCATVRDNVTNWGDNWKCEIAMFVESLHEKIKSAEIEATRILEEQIYQMKHNIQDIENVLKDYENIKMSENSKLIVNFHSQIDQLSTLPIARRIYVPEFISSINNLQSHLQKSFGKLIVVDNYVDKELKTPSQIRSSKEIFSVVNQRHGGIFRTHKDRCRTAQLSRGIYQKCQVPLHPKLLFGFHKSPPFQRNIEKFLTDLKAKPLWSESTRHDEEAYLMIQSTYSIAYSGDPWKETVTAALTSYLQEWEVSSFDVPYYLWDTVVEKIKNIWISNPDKVLCHCSKKEHQVFVIGNTEDAVELSLRVQEFMKYI